MDNRRAREATGSPLSNTLLETVLETIGEGILTIDRHSIIVMANREAHRIWGYAEGELRGKPLSILIPEVYREPHERGMRRYLETGEARVLDRRMELEGLRKDGAIFPLELRIQETKVDDQVLFTAAVRDISDRRAAERALEVSERRLRATFEQAAVGMANVSPAGRWLDVNERLCQILGYSKAELLQLTFQDITHPDDLEADLLHAQQLLSGEVATYTMEKRYLRKAGQTVWAHMTVSLVRDPRGRPHYFIAAVEDITARKQTEQALRFSEERFRALVEQAPLSIQIMAPDSRTLLVNDAWAQLWGLTLEQIRDYVMLEDPQLIDKGIMPFIKLGFAGQPSEIPSILYDPNETIPDRTRHSDPRRWVKAFIYPVQDESGQIREVVLIHQDITEEQLAQEEVRRLNLDLQQRVEDLKRVAQENRELYEQAQQAIEIRDQFVSLAAHELKTPMTTILGSAQLLHRYILRSEHADERERSRAQTLIDQVQRMHRLISSLLDLSRIQAGRLTIERELVDLCAIGHQLVRELQPTLDHHTLSFESPAGSCEVNGDRLRLEQVLQNLLQNAIKYSPTGGKIEMRVLLRETSYCFEIVDQGIGIPSADLPRIFDRFFRASNVDVQQLSGMGIGLYVVNEIISQHGGSISVQSEEGQGSTFTICIPRA